MLEKLLSHEEKLLRIIIDNCNKTTQQFSFSTDLLPPELRVYRDALLSLVRKGYIISKPYIRVISGYATEEGMTYFVAKEQNKQMVILKGKARDLLLELIGVESSIVTDELAKKFDGLDNSQDTELRATIMYLKDCGYLNVPLWADDVPYNASLTYAGQHYLEHEADHFMQVAQSSPVITVHGGQVNIASGQSSIVANQYNGLDAQALSSLIAAIKNCVDDLRSDEDIECANDSLEVLEGELTQQKPKRSLIRTALTALQTIKGTTEFAAAVAALVQFVQQFV